MLAPHVESGRLQILLRTKTVAARISGDRIETVTVHGSRPGGAPLRPADVRDRRNRARRPAAARRDRATGSAPSRSRRPASRMPSRWSRSRAACRASPTPSPSSVLRRARATSSRRPEKYEHYRDAAAVQPHDRGPRRRDLRRGERLALLPPVRGDARHEGRRCGPTVGWSTPRHFPAPLHATSRCSTGRATTTATRASSTLPRDASPQRCRTPSASASASCTGCRPRRRQRPIASARRSSGCGPT